MDINQKYDDLKRILHSYGSVAVAYSNGVDSTFLLNTAHQVLGDKAIAITVRSCLIPKREIDEAEDFCKKENIRHILSDIDPLEIEGFADNLPNRCYLCKSVDFGMIKKIACENGISEVAEGSNLDDNGDYRPGMRAISELEIKSPLREAGFSKQEIREMSRRLGLHTWNKPSLACLASRFAYGEKITAEGLSRVDKAEIMLAESGFSQFRVRVHGNIARIEILQDDFEKLLIIRKQISESFKQLGFKYITMDLQGYRTGSMNEIL